MTLRPDRRLYGILQVVANCLQTAVLTAERLRNTSTIVEQDSRVLIRSLKQATRALRRLQLTRDTRLRH